MLNTRRKAAVGQGAHGQLRIGRIVFNQENIGKASPGLRLVLKRWFHLLKDIILHVLRKLKEKIGCEKNIEDTIEIETGRLLCSGNFRNTAEPARLAEIELEHPAFAIRWVKRLVSFVGILKTHRLCIPFQLHGRPIIAGDEPIGHRGRPIRSYRVRCQSARTSHPARALRCPRR